MRVPQEHGEQYQSQPDRGTYIELIQAQAPRRPQLLRATTDIGPRGQSPNPAPADDDDENWELRHGWEGEYNSEEYLNKLNSVSSALRL